MINLDKYIKLKKEREDNKKKSYKKVLKQIIYQMENVMNQEVDFLVYEMAPFIIGEIEYEMLECVDYIISKINKDKSFIKLSGQINFFEPNILYLKWKNP